MIPIRIYPKKKKDRLDLLETYWFNLSEHVYRKEQKKEKREKRESITHLNRLMMVDSYSTVFGLPWKREREREREREIAERDGLMWARQSAMGLISSTHSWACKSESSPPQKLNK